MHPLGPRREAAYSPYLNSADNAMVSEEEACHIAVRIKKQKELSLLTK